MNSSAASTLCLMFGATARTNRMETSTRALGVLLALLLPIALLTGCASPPPVYSSPSYKSAARQVSPPVLLNIPSTEPPFEALLHTVIVYHGPGSWKLDAYWDEYVVTLANRGDALVTIESASLTDFQDQVAAAENDPWKLDEAGRKRTAKDFRPDGFGAFLLGPGATVLAADAQAATPVPPTSVKRTAATVGAAAGGLALSTITTPALWGVGLGAAAVGATVYGVVGGAAMSDALMYNANNSPSAIEREFERRRLVLPAILVPGQQVHGSLFFRISPGPKRLTLRCRVDDEPREVVINLEPIAGLHFKLSTAPATRSEPGP